MTRRLWISAALTIVGCAPTAPDMIVDARPPAPGGASRPTRGCAPGESPKACARRGLGAMNGNTKAFVQGYELLTDACRQGAAQACYHLGVVHRAGVGVPFHQATATKYFETACQAGASSACKVPQRFDALDTTVVRAIMRNQRRAIRTCQERQATGSGQVRVRFAVTGGGDVLSASVASSTLNRPVVESCLVRTLRQVTFPNPSKAVSIAEYDFNLLSTGATVAATSGDRPKAAKRGSILLQDSLTSEMGRHKVAFDACFQAAARRRPGLAGTLRARLRVGTDGKVRTMLPVEDRLKDDRLFGCLSAQAARRVELPREERAGMAEVEHTFAYGVPAPVAAPLQGKLDKDDLKETMRKNGAAFALCYERELKENPEYKGLIKIRFSIEPDGRVPDASVYDTTIPGDRFESCMLSAMRKVTFPKPKGGRVIVNYPFNFGS